LIQLREHPLIFFLFLPFYETISHILLIEVFVIDSEGFRSNVGIILANKAGRVFWARRIGQEAWQFPQGGIQEDETPEQALFRELSEEVGLSEQDVEILGCTKGWLKYRLPTRFIRKNCLPLCIGQKQKWFLLHLLCPETCIQLDKGHRPEFDRWRWVSYWYPIQKVVSFKRQVYRRALIELVPVMKQFKLAHAVSENKE
jgi:putative (di)nucleoside polyphosphate hydrolase